MVDKITEFLKALTFLRAIWILSGAIIVLAIINTILVPRVPYVALPGTPLSDIGIGQSVSYEVIGDTYVEDPATYNDKRLLKVYAEDFSELSEIETEKLISGALREAGLTRNQTYIVLVSEDQLRNAEDLHDITQEDPLNPSTYVEFDPDNYGRRKYEYEKLNAMNLAFSTWVDIVKPATDLYEIYEIQEGSYLVVLKSEYTQEDFREQILSQFADLENYSYEFEQRSVFKEEEL